MEIREPDIILLISLSTYKWIWPQSSYNWKVMLSFINSFMCGSDVIFICKVRFSIWVIIRMVLLLRTVF